MALASTLRRELARLTKAAAAELEPRATPAAP
jgi:hypothetical protein